MRACHSSLSRSFDGNTSTKACKDSSAARCVARKILAQPMNPCAAQHLTLREFDVWVVGKGVLSSSRQTQKASPPHRAA